MKVREIFNEIEMQGTIRICYYNEFKNKLVIVKRSEAVDEKNIRYMYAKGNILYIELETDDL